MPAFKTEESFLEKISIGAIGTQQVFTVLKKLGHQPIELERGSMNYKIWKKIKIKRERVPDILCVDNGIRIESRAKTKLEISMSHSSSDPKRGWDYGLRDNDYVALVVCEKNGNNPIDWKADDLVQFVLVKNLKESEKKGTVIYSTPKGSQEGFESRIVWPSGLASTTGIITEIESSIKYKTQSNRTNTIKLSKKGKILSPLIQVGDHVQPNQIIASVVEVKQTIPMNKVDVSFFLNNLSSYDMSERYAAAKALSYFDNNQVSPVLLTRLRDTKEHIYVMLEIAATLSRFGFHEGYKFIENCLSDSYLQNVLEAVIVLAEIHSTKSCTMLCNILLDENYDSEIRAGAAWGLGELQNKEALSTIVKSFNYIDENIKVEAARALAKLTTHFSEDIVGLLKTASASEMPGIAWALSKSKSITIDQLTDNLNNLETRQWISYILGMQGQEKYVAEIEKLKNIDIEVYFATTLLWKIITSWVYKLKEY